MLELTNLKKEKSFQCQLVLKELTDGNVDSNWFLFTIASSDLFTDVWWNLSPIENILFWKRAKYLVLISHIMHI